MIDDIDDGPDVVSGWDDDVPELEIGRDYIRYDAIAKASARIRDLAARFVASISSTNAGKVFLEDYPLERMKPGTRIKCTDIDWLLGWLEHDNQMPDGLPAIVDELRDRLRTGTEATPSFRYVNSWMNASGSYKACSALFAEAMAAGDTPDVITFNIWLKFCRTESEVVNVLDLMRVRGIKPDNFTACACNVVVNKRKSFEAMWAIYLAMVRAGSTVDKYTLGPMARVCRTGEQCVNLFRAMTAHGVSPDANMVRIFVDTTWHLTDIQAINEWFESPNSQGFPGFDPIRRIVQRWIQGRSAVAEG